MKKIKHILRVLFFCIAFLVIGGLVLALSLRYKYYYHLENRPSSQKNTAWCSENGEISIHIDEHGKGRISFERNGYTTECYFISSVGYYAKVYDWEVTETNILTSEALREKWLYKKVKKDSFKIKVEQTSFLEVGKEITFYKMKTGDGSLS